MYLDRTTRTCWQEIIFDCLYFYDLLGHGWGISYYSMSRRHSRTDPHYHFKTDVS